MTCFSLSTAGGDCSPTLTRLAASALIAGRICQTTFVRVQYITNCQQFSDAHKARVQKVWDRRVSSSKDIIEISQEVTALRSIYLGREQDERDLVLMQQILEMIKGHCDQIASLDLPEDVFRSESARLLQEAIERQFRRHHERSEFAQILDARIE